MFQGNDLKSHFSFNCLKFYATRKGFLYLNKVLMYLTLAKLLCKSAHFMNPQLKLIFCAIFFFLLLAVFFSYLLFEGL